MKTNLLKLIALILLTLFLVNSCGIYKRSDVKDNPINVDDRVKKNIDTTFKSSFKKTIGLEDVLSLKYIREYARTGTGSKYLINPQIRSANK